MKQPTVRRGNCLSRGYGLFSIMACLLFMAGLPSAGHSANITAFGDSITYGFSSSTGGYPPKLSALLNGNGKPSTVVNKGINGEQTPQGVNRFDSVLDSFPANIILILEGTNDINSGLSVQTTEFNLQEMINKAKAKGVIPVLATLTPSNRRGAETLIPNTWNPMIIGLATNNAIILSDQYSAILPTWGSSNADGLHPNDTGYQTMANTWYASINGLIASSGGVDTGGGDSGGGGGGGGCFIATAAFGSPMEKHVVLLKDFRDKILLTHSLGKRFVAAYYRYSPPLADFIAEHEMVKKVVRVLLYPLIGFSYLLLNLSMPVLLLLLFASIGSLAGTVYLFKRYRVRRKSDIRFA